MLRRVNFICLLGLCITSITLFAQDPYHRVFTVADGLPSDEAYDLEVDSLNQIWITTDRGLCVYNGYDFETFTTKDGLGDNTNFEIFVDKSDRLWLTGYNGSLTYLENGEFKIYEYVDELKSFFPNTGNYFRDIWQDDRGVYYVVASRPYKPTIATFLFGSIPREIDMSERMGLDLAALSDLAKSGNNLFWIDTYVSHFFNSFQPSRSLRSAPVHETDEYVFYRSTGALTRKDKRSESIEMFPFVGSIEYIHVDNRNDLWVCTKDGIYRFLNCDFSVPPEHYFAGQAISSVRRDLEDGVWLSTNESGVYYVPSFDFKKGIAETNRKVNYTSLKSFNNKLIIGNTDTRLLALSENGTSEEFRLNKEDQGLLFGDFYVTQDETELLLNRGYKLATSGGSFELSKKNLPGQPYGRQTMELQNSHKISTKHPGYVVVLSDSTLIYKSTKGTSSYGKYFSFFFQDKEEKIWAGALEGLFVIENYNYDEISEITFKSKSLGRTSSLKSDALGNYWVSTIGNGLYYISASDTLNISEQDGLQSNMINNLLVLNDTTLLAAGNAGINRIVYSFEGERISVESIEHLSSSHGLPSDFVNALEFWNGKIWAATNKGICHFDEREFKRACADLPVTLKFVSVNNEKQSLEKKLKLDHRQNDVHLGFISSSYRNVSGDETYVYRLISDDDDTSTDWISTSSTEVRFNNLVHGDYIFEVRTAESCTVELARSDSFNFEIEPHFTKTAWFRSLTALALTASLCFIALFARRRFLKEELKRSKLRETEFQLQTAELSALRNQMNPHFVFNSLNSIQNFIFKNDVRNANLFISKLSQLMREGLQYSRLDFITLNQELDFLKKYILLESMRFPDLFDFEIDMEEEIEQEVDNLLMPSLLLQPILENSIKHAFKKIDYKGRVILKVYRGEKDLLNFEISDNGSGIVKEKVSNTKNKEHKSLGLEIINNRLRLLNESLFGGRANVTTDNRFLGTYGLRVLVQIPFKYAYDESNNH